jgi:hypothetical protein
MARLLSRVNVNQKPAPVVIVVPIARAIPEPRVAFVIFPVVPVFPAPAVTLEKISVPALGPACLIQQNAKEKAWPSSPRTKMTGCCRR